MEDMLILMKNTLLEERHREECDHETRILILVCLMCHVLVSFGT